MDSIFDVSKKEFLLWLKDEGEPLFRLKQLLQWIYSHQAISFSQMSNLGTKLRKKLEVRYQIGTLRKVRILESDDGETHKYLWRLKDGSLVESVLITSGKRKTVCVSSQVGCAAKCAFCASGKEGWKRHLSQGEIVEQVVSIDRELKGKGERVSHVVFMGMGEPLLNYKAVIGAINILCDPQMMGISQRRITVSTVGILEGIEKLKGAGLKVNLVLSLHAPNQKVRKKIIPYARRYEYDELLDAMDSYARTTSRNMTYEYILIEGINDQQEHALELTQRLKNHACTVNLIPYNPIDGVKLRRPKTQAIKAFMNTLVKGGLVVTCRWTKGKDIAAACGQLALQKDTSGVMAA